MLKTVGLAEPLRDALKRVASDIRAAFVHGSVAKAADQAGSDIDLMVVSDTLSYGDVFGALDKLSRTLGRNVNPTVYSAAEFSKRAKNAERLHRGRARGTKGVGHRLTKMTSRSSLENGSPAGAGTE